MALLAASALAGVRRLSYLESLDPAALRVLARGFGAWAPACWVGLISLRPVVFMPSSATMIAGGLIFGVWAGTVLTTLGFTLAALFTYLLGRWLGYDYVHARLGGVLERLWEARLGPELVALLNAVPIVPLSIPNYGAGLVGVPVTAFLAATAVGLAPRVLAWSLMGNVLVRYDTRELAAAATLLVLLVAVPFAVPSFRERLTALWKGKG